MNLGMRIRPRISLLDEEAREQIHDASIEILMKVGVEVHGDVARRVLVEAGAEERDGRICFPEELVAWALSVAPSEVEVFDRHGRTSFTLSGIADQPTRFGLGVTNLHYEEPATSQIVPFERKHLALGARLSNGLQHCDLVSTLGTPHDVPQALQDLVSTLEMAANTTKPLVILGTDEKQFGCVLDLLDIVCPYRQGRSCALIYLNPSTPLAIHPATCSKMEASIRRGYPVVFSNYGMSGATAPVDPWGTLVLLNAELLAGLVLGQCLREGAPMILGSLPAAFDFSGKGSAYTPHSFLSNLGCIEMMRHYRLPHCGTSGCGAGCGADLVASGNLWMSHLSMVLGGGGLAPFVGGSFDSMVFSPMLAVYSDWVIDQCRTFAAGMEVSEPCDLSEIIEAVQCPEHFLVSTSTVDRHRDFAADGLLQPNRSLDQWVQSGPPEPVDLLRETTLKILESAPPPVDRDEVLEVGSRFMASRS